MSMENIIFPLSGTALKRIYPSDIVQHSFIGQNSISPLAFKVGESYKSRTRSSDSYSRWAPYNVINTEEKFQKIRSRSRSLLNNLNLDLPKARKGILKSESIPKHLETSVDHLCVPGIEIDDRFYLDLVRYIMHYICNHPSCIDSHRREKVLKFFVKLDVFNCYAQVSLSPVVLMHLVDSMHVEFEDTDFVEKCFKKFRFADMLKVNDNPERVENLLYLVNRQGAKLERGIWGGEFSDRCFLHPSFEYVERVLKFLYAPHLSTSFIDLLAKGLLKIRPFHPVSYIPKNLQKERIYIDKRRCALLLHLYWTYFYKSVNPSAAAKSLRLLWNAVPDSFISYKEIDSLFIRVVFKEIDDIYGFYSEAVGEYHEDFNPRSLRHFCRYTIRKGLWKSNQWIPEGIEQLGLPPKLQSYLKLET